MARLAFLSAIRFSVWSSIGVSIEIKAFNSIVLFTRRGYRNDTSPRSYNLFISFFMVDCPSPQRCVSLSCHSCGKSDVPTCKVGGKSTTCTKRSLYRTNRRLITAVQKSIDYENVRDINCLDSSSMREK